MVIELQSFWIGFGVGVLALVAIGSLFILSCIVDK